MGAALTLEPRALARGAGRVLVAHLLLLALWPALRYAYAPAYRELAQLGMSMLDPLPGKIDVTFTPGAGGLLARDLVAMDTVVSLTPRAPGAIPATFGGSSFFHGWAPTSVLLALFVGGVPLPWKRKRSALLWALVLLHLGLLARILPSVFYCYSQCTIDGVPALGLGPAGQRLLFLARNATWVEVFPNYLGPLLLYGVCVFGPTSPTER